MPTTRASFDDPRLAPYANLTDRDLAREGDRFIAEGELVTKRLLASGYEVESVVCSERLLPEIEPLAGSRGVPVYVLPDREIDRVVGFKFHNGCLAVGRRGASLGVRDLPLGRDRLLILVATELNSASNLGGIIRSAAGFGADAILVGERCVDPFWRQSVRVSMGTVFALPIVRCHDLLADLAVLRDARVELLATVCDGGEPIDRIGPVPRGAIVLGSEPQGLSAAQVEACTRRVTIPMRLGTDSLNVTIAAAIFLYELSRPDPKTA